jgi:hypothetical protein
MAKPVTTSNAGDARVRSPDTTGRYEVIGCLGQGGMGVV